MKMKITETNAIPLYRNLCEVSADKLFHEKHEIVLSHPADILYEKFNALSDNLVHLIEIKDSGAYENDKIKCTQDFILEMDAFYDALPLIIKCFVEPNGTDNKDVTRWLNKNPQYIKLKDSTSSHHKIISKIANVIKHDHVAFTLVTVVNHNNYDVSGFYIEKTIGENNLKGADRDIHPIYTHKKTHQECDTAFSYNHFLLYCIGCIFNYMDRLNSILFDKTKPQNNPKFSEPLNVLKAAQKIEQQFYPDEYTEPYALIEKIPDGSSIEFPFRYKKKPSEDFDNIKSFSANLRFTQRTNTASNRLPYFFRSLK
jgi:hypothetical protein